MNLKYYVHDGTHLVSTGVMPVGQLAHARQNLTDGLTLVLGEDPTLGNPRPSIHHQFNVTSGAWEDLRDAQTQAYDDYVAIQVARRNAYPSVGDQLDALFKAMDAGQLPQVTGFYDAIKAVKNAHPLPASQPPVPVRLTPKLAFKMGPPPATTPAPTPAQPPAPTPAPPSPTQPPTPSPSPPPQAQGGHP
jgi:hypothetical protein